MAGNAAAYEKVTARIVALLEQGEIPWRKPWGGAGSVGVSLQTGRQYRGVNAFITAIQGYDCQLWATFNQIKKRGGKVCKGEKGTPILFWRWIEKEKTADDGTKRVKGFPFARVYHVFNLLQTEGLEDLIPPVVGTPTTPIETDTQCNEIVATMPNPPRIQHGGNRACYSPGGDTVTMPPKSSFESAVGYHSTLFHELGHATGHTSRLNRKDLMSGHRFGSAGYAREELCAELTASFLCGVTGIENESENHEELQNHAAYIQSWLGRLKDDPALIPVAAQQAQKAADFILGEAPVSARSVA